MKTKFMHKVLLFTLILFLSISCTSEKKDDISGKLNEVCKTNEICNDDLACVENKCILKEDACKFITCSGEDGYTHGTCTVESSKVTCNCDDNYEVVKDTKCELSSTQELCKEDTCDTENGYICTIEDNEAKCVCPNNYKETEGHDMCILDEISVCKDVKCDLNKNMTGYCRAYIEGTTIEIYCECERGWKGETCEQEDRGCDKAFCLNDENATGECYVDVSDPEKQTICICKEGYEFSDDNKCVVSE